MSVARQRVAGASAGKYIAFAGGVSETMSTDVILCTEAYFGGGGTTRDIVNPQYFDSLIIYDVILVSI